MSLPMQKARYHGHASALSFGVSSNGNNQVAVTFEITDHDDHHGESITWIGHFTDKTAARTIESLQNAGWQGDDLSELDGLDEAGVRAALPEMVELVCEPEEYAPDHAQPEWILRVRWVNRPGGRFAFKEPLTGQGLKAFAAQMRNTVRSVRGGAHRASNGSSERSGAHEQSRGVPPSGRTSAHPNAPGNQNDIPF